MANSTEDGYIDAHVHVWTPDLKKYPLASGYEREGMAVASFTPEELFAHARPCGVSRIVLIQMSYYRFDNSYMLDMMEKHRGVFSGVGKVDAQRPAPARDDRIVEAGCSGLPSRYRQLARPTSGWATRAWRRCGNAGPSRTWRSAS